jgi:hypothetical protein
LRGSNLGEGEQAPADALRMTELDRERQAFLDDRLRARVVVSEALASGDDAEHTHQQPAVATRSRGDETLPHELLRSRGLAS